MADLIAYTDLQTYLAINTGQTVTFGAGEITVATLCCTAASDGVKLACNRTFEIQSTAADRYFTAAYPYSDSIGALALYYPWPGVFPFTALTAGLPAPILRVDDYFLTNQVLANITVTDKTTLTTYTPTYAYPYNADSKGMPYTGLVFAPGTAMSSAEGQMKVNAKWGFVTSIPNTAKEAALMQAARFYKRTGAPFGIAGNDAMGNAMRLQAKLDPDVEQMLGTYRKWYAAA